MMVSLLLSFITISIASLSKQSEAALAEQSAAERAQVSASKSECFGFTDDLWPLPKKVAIKSCGWMPVHQLRVSGVHADSVVGRAVQRVLGLTPGAEPRSGHAANSSANAVDVLHIDLQMPNAGNLVSLIEGGSAMLGPAMDESYVLDIASPKATLSAKSPVGALRGLQSFAQLVRSRVDDAAGGRRDGLGAFSEKRLLASGNAGVRGAVKIEDEPRFGHRGVLIDSARHFLPVATMKSFLDSMEMNKLNVLHWHLTDSQSYSLGDKVSRKYGLSEGSLFPGGTYNETDLRGLVDYAADRGIRIVPEVDSPGHVQSFLRSNVKNVRDELVDCGYNSVLTPVGNPEVPKMMHELLSHLGEIFPDSYFHVGTDEVDFNCLRQSPTVRKWAAERRSLLEKKEDEFEDGDDLSFLQEKEYSDEDAKAKEAKTGTDTVVQNLRRVSAVSKQARRVPGRAVLSSMEISAKGAKESASSSGEKDGTEPLQVDGDLLSPPGKAGKSSPQRNASRVRNATNASSFLEEDEDEEFLSDDVLKSAVADYISMVTGTAEKVGKTPIVWQEAYDKYGKGTFGYGYTPPHLDKHTIVQMWEGWPGTARVRDLAAKKFPMIRSYDWYLDNGEDNDWMQRYRVDPVDGLNGEAATYIKGGEACLWGEHIDQTNLFSRAYPRLSAVAERLWSPEEVREPYEAEMRMAHMRCRMQAKGYHAAPFDCPVGFQP